MKPPEEKVTGIEENNPRSVAGFFRGIARIPVGIVMGATALGVGIARGIVGMGVNLALAGCGALATLAVGTVHVFNFARVQVIKSFNSKDPERKNPNVDETKNLVEKIYSFTVQRFGAAINSIPNVLSGKQDEAIKGNLLEFRENLPKYRENLVNLKESLLAKLFKKKNNSEIELTGSPSSKKTVDIESLDDKHRLLPKDSKIDMKKILDKTPNTKDILIASLRLAMGMSKEEREAADNRIKNQTGARKR